MEIHGEDCLGQNDLEGFAADLFLPWLKGEEKERKPEWFSIINNSLKLEVHWL
jgi:hypothetical protein